MVHVDYEPGRAGFYQDAVDRHVALSTDVYRTGVCAVRTVGAHRRLFHGRPRTGACSGVFRLDRCRSVGLVGASAIALMACRLSAMRAGHRVRMPVGHAGLDVVQYPAVFVPSRAARGHVAQSAARRNRRR
jgi:hypothetical protein